MSQHEPCPIPRCALEWHCAFSLIIVAVVIEALVPNGAAINLLGLGHTQFGWAIFLGFSGAAQAAALGTKYRVIQRWTALSGCFISVLILGSIVASPASLDATLITIGMLSPIIGSEGYVFLLLKGARWSRASLAG